MSYKDAFHEFSNIRVEAFSPRLVGEKAKNSWWIELPKMTMDFAVRCRVIKMFARAGFQVWVRPATHGGRCRVWVNPKDGVA